MKNLAVTNIIKEYHVFDKKFWLTYKTLEKIHPDFESIKLKLLKTKYIHKKYYQDLENFETERALLAAEWEAKNEEAKSVGIETHEYIHNLFCTDLKTCKTDFNIPTDSYKVKQLEEFMTADSGLFVEHRLEYQLDDSYNLVGIPDCFLIHDGVVDIWDWKVLDQAPKFKSMYDASKKSLKKLKYPLNNTDDCNGMHYTIQLGIYMWMILKLRPDLKPGVLHLVWVKDKKIKKSYEVYYLEDKIEKLMAWHVKNLHFKEEAAKCRELKYE